MKPVGSTVRLTYQTPEEVAEGDALVTVKTGRIYLVTAARRMSSSKPGMWALRCMVSDVAPRLGRLHPLFWNPRRPRA